jgi:hypothetical protein
MKFGMSSVEVDLDVTADAPATTSALRRVLKHPRLSHYNRLIAVVLLLNTCALLYGLHWDEWAISNGRAISEMLNLVFANFALGW